MQLDNMERGVDKEVSGLHLCKMQLFVVNKED